MFLRLSQEEIKFTNTKDLTVLTYILCYLPGLQCHELRKDWQSIVSMSQFIIQGISVTIIGIFGFAGNILSVIVLLQA